MQQFLLKLKKVDRGNSINGETDKLWSSQIGFRSWTCHILRLGLLIYKVDMGLVTYGTGVDSKGGHASQGLVQCLAHVKDSRDNSQSQ